MSIKSMSNKTKLIVNFTKKYLICLNNCGKLKMYLSIKWLRSWIMRKIFLCIIVFVVIMFVSFNQSKNYTYEQEIFSSDEVYTMEIINFFAMDTYITLKASGENASLVLEQGKQFLLDFEEIISYYNEASELFQLNNNNGEELQVSDELYNVIKTAKEYAEFTDGVFDPTIASVTKLWEFNGSSSRIPTQEQIDIALRSVSYENIVLLDDNYVKLLNDAKIELGAIGKGIAGDYLYELYEKNGIENGIISLSGNVYLVGEKDVDTPWTVGITDPEATEQHNIAVKLSDTSIVTAGAYERCFWHEGEFYHHIIDTKTGYPTTQDITSVTIISKNSTLADVCSTTLFALGYDNAIEFLAENTDIDAIIINSDNQVFLTDNINEQTLIGSKYLTN